MERSYKGYNASMYYMLYFEDVCTYTTKASSPESAIWHVFNLQCRVILEIISSCLRLLPVPLVGPVPRQTV